MDALIDTWNNLQSIIEQRDIELAKEHKRQEENDRLRKDYAESANNFHQWITLTRMWLLDGTAMTEELTLEDQLEATKRKAEEIRLKRNDLKVIELKGSNLEEHLILDNRYTEFSTVALGNLFKNTFLNPNFNLVNCLIFISSFSTTVGSTKSTSDANGTQSRTANTRYVVLIIK